MREFKTIEREVDVLFDANMSPRPSSASHLCHLLERCVACDLVSEYIAVLPVVFPHPTPRYVRLFDVVFPSKRRSVPVHPGMREATSKRLLGEIYVIKLRVVCCCLF